MSTNEYMSAEELGIQNHLCLLPFREETKYGIINWTAKELKPYQSYIVNDVPVDSMFGGLIFNPIRGRKNHFINPMYADFGALPEKADWKLVLEGLFKKHYNLDAAAKNTLIDKKTDIWVTIPYPILTQTNFGLLEGRRINFKKETDRYAAMTWWIKKFLSKWNKNIILKKSLTFRGFVWPRASIDSRDESLVKQVTAYIRKKGFLSLWLQQYGSVGCVEWKKFGFDAACTHPNYYGATWPDYKWIDNSTVFARYFRTGMQITFGKGLLYKENHLLDYLNYGVYNEYMKKSLLVFQFPNQSIHKIYKSHPKEYVYLYSFIKKTYTPIFPTAAFSAEKKSKLVSNP